MKSNLTNKMPFPFFSDIRKSLFDDNDGTFGDNTFGTGSGKISVKSKASNGQKFDADVATGGKSTFKYTYPKLGRGKFTGDLAVKATLSGGKSSYKVQFKKLKINDENVADLTYDAKKKNFTAEIKSQQKKFGVYAKVDFGLGDGVADALKSPSGRIEVVGGQGDNTFGAGIDFEVGAEDGFAGPLKNPELVGVFRPADGLEIVAETDVQGFLKQNPHFKFGTTVNVDANNTLCFMYDCDTKGGDATGAFGGTRKVGADTLHYAFAQDGTVSGSYTTSLADHVEGVVTFSKDMKEMTLDGAEFGYELNFS